MKKVLMGIQVILLLSPAGPVMAQFSPWGPLTNDSWIYFGGSQTIMTIYTVNGSDYPVGFDQAPSSNIARGLNALKFSFGAGSTGHLSSASSTGSFTILNTGGSRTFADLVLLVAIDANALPDDFSMSLGKQGQSTYQFNTANDFVFYNHPEYNTGRPTGYYSITSPAGEGISYTFSSGMVTAFAVSGANLGPSGFITINYTFNHLPGTVVFSVYGYDSAVGWIYHTNRGLIDDNNPGNPVSTFEVSPIHGTLILSDFSGNCEGITAQLTFRSLTNGDNLTRTAALRANGTFTLDNVTSDNYTLAVRVSHWLQKVIPSVTISDNSTDLGGITLINGDVDGDNAITSLDLGLILNNLDLATNDLDGDGEVTSTDLSIVLNNIGVAGDP